MPPDENGAPMTFDEAMAQAQAAVQAEAQAQAQAQAEAQATQEGAPPDGQPPETPPSDATQAQPAEAQATQAQAEVQSAQPAEAQAAQLDPQAMQVIAQLTQQNQMLQQAINEMSRQNETQVTEEVLTPPELDLSNLWAEDENVIKQKQADYARQMAEYTEKKIMGTLQPFLTSAQTGIEEREKQRALDGLSKDPRFAGVMGMTPRLEQIISSNPILNSSTAPIEDKLIMAYAIAKGADSIENPPVAPSTEDFMQMYAQSPELRRAVEEMRAKSAAEQAVNIPPMSASAGAANAPLTPPQKKPTNFDEARMAVLAQFGMR